MMHMFTSSRRGFTLIELLVVVLIVGILAAVAVPQYQKAVLKSRLTEIMVSMSNMQKAVNVYLLANGLPDETIYFTKQDAEATLDIDLPCKSRGVERCYTERGEWSIACTSTGCWIDSTLGTWAEGFHIAIRRTGEDHLWKLYRLPTEERGRKVVCQWWVNNYGTNSFFTGSYGDPAQLCAAAGV